MFRKTDSGRAAPNFLVLGHITKDMVGDDYKLGGTALYSALTAARLGRRVGIVTSFSSELRLGSLPKTIRVCHVDSPVTTTYRNIYLNEQRVQEVKAIARGITLNDIPPAWLETPVVHLGPVVHELEPSLIFAFSRSLIGLTPQGWLRQWDESGRIYPRRWLDEEKVLAQVQALILSEEDIAKDENLIADFANRARPLVVTQGRKGARVHYRGEWRQFPAFPSVEKQTTGAGDVFAAAYLCHLACSQDPFASTVFANCVASFFVEKGIEGLPTLPQVEKRLTQTAPLITV